MHNATKSNTLRIQRDFNEDSLGWLNLDKEKALQLSDEPWLTKGQGAMTRRIITLAVAASALAVAASALAFSALALAVAASASARSCITLVVAASALALAASASSHCCSASYQHFSVATAYNTW